MTTFKCFTCVQLLRQSSKDISSLNRKAVANYGFLPFTSDKHKSMTSPKPKLSLTTPETNTKEKTGLASHLMGRDFLSLNHFSSDDIKQFLWTAKDLKTRIKDNGETYQPFLGKTVALITQKQSLHTQLSAELGMAKLGGHVCYLRQDDITSGVKGRIKDSARVLASMADLILAEVNTQDILDELANESNIPVVSGLSGLLHPLQILADFMTLQEYFGYVRGVKIAWVGGCSSVLHSLMYGCAKFGMDLSVAMPVGYQPDPKIIADTMKMSMETGGSFLFGHDPHKAAYRADAIITDSWVSLEQGDENKKLQDFAGYQINRKMMKEAGGDWVFLHPLSTHDGEVTDDIIYGKESLVWQEAENRMWTVMAVMLHLLQPYTPTIPMPKYVRG